MVRPRENQTECILCHRFIPRYTKGGMCDECRDRVSRPVQCENCGRETESTIHVNGLRVCSMSCKAELKKLLQLR